MGLDLPARACEWVCCCARMHKQHDCLCHIGQACGLKELSELTFPFFTARSQNIHFSLSVEIVECGQSFALQCRGLMKNASDMLGPRLSWLCCRVVRSMTIAQCVQGAPTKK